MPRKKLIKTSEFPYHITTRCNNREWFKISISDVWNFSILSLLETLKKHPANIHLFVLMNNHYHLIIDTPDENINLFMYEFNKRLSYLLREKSNRINRVFGARYSWTIITKQNYYHNVIKYVALNPVKSKVIAKAQEYPYSTMFIHLQIEINLKPYIDLQDLNVLEWINQNYNEEQNISIKKGLNNSKFKFSGSRDERVPPYFSEITLG